MHPLYQALTQKKSLDYQHLNYLFQELVSKVICRSVRLASVERDQHFQLLTDWIDRGGGCCCYGVKQDGKGESWFG